MQNSATDPKIRNLVLAGVFAALTYIVFTFLSIPIPTPGGGKVSVHLGNAFCILGVLLLGTGYGSAAGALGLVVADLLDPVYIIEAPITFVLKLLMGLIAGLVAHRLLHIDEQTEHPRILRAAAIASAAALLFNAICDPLARYAYKILIIGKPAAEVTLAVNMVVTIINSVVSVFVVVILYMALRAPLRKLGLIGESLSEA